MSNHKSPQAQPNQPLVIGISSRILFDLDESHKIFEQQGLDAYKEHQIAMEDKILKHGAAFQLVEKLLRLNKDDLQRIEIMLISRNSADTGLRIFNSIEHYKLPITRAAFCSGRTPFSYIEPFGCQLFLSADENDVRDALAHGIAAARIINLNRADKLSQAKGPQQQQEVRIAFDGDAVLFSDQSERIYQQKGLKEFNQNETSQSNNELPGGPFKSFLASIYQVQQSYPPPQICPIRTALVTARSAPAHKRVILTLRKWGIRLDESFFLGGLHKHKFLEAFRADIFFDDQLSNCNAAADGITTGHIPYGVANQKKVAAKPSSPTTN